MKLALAALLVFVLLVPLHTQDGPNHRQVAAITARLHASPIEAALYQSTLAPLQTNSLYTLGFLVADRFGVQPRVYERAFLALALALTLLAYRSFLRTWSPERAHYWVWALPLLLHTLFTTGMYNFVAACALTLWAMAFLHGALAGSVRALAALAAICWVALLAHPFPFLVLPVAWLALLSARNARSAMTWFAGGIIAVFAIIAIVLPAVSGSAVALEPYTWKPPHELLAGLTYYNFEAFSPAHLVVITCIVLAAVALAIAAFRHSGWRGNALLLAMLIGYAVFPNAGRGGAHMNERFLVFAWAFLPLGLPASLAAVRPIAITSALTQAGIVALGMTSVATDVADARRVLAGIPDGARLLPMQFDESGASFTQSRALHLWAEYPEARVVHSPFLFAYLDVMPLRRRLPATDTWFPTMPENLPQRLAESPDTAGWRRLEAVAAYYDWWFVDAPPPEFHARLASIPGVERVAAAGSSSLWRNRNARPFVPAIEP